MKTSAVVWHSSLSDGNRKSLERVQKAALKIILKNHYNSYEDALKILKMESLEDRRARLCLKFAKNCLKNSKMKKLFPLAQVQHVMKTRSKEKFEVYYARTKRYRKSAIPYLQGLLNAEAKKTKKLLS